MLVLYIIIGELDVYYLFWSSPGLGVIFFLILMMELLTGACACFGGWLL